MNQRRHLAFVAGAATLLASTALASVYESKGYFFFVIQSPNWFLYIAAVIAAVVGGATGARAMRAPLWAQPVAGTLALLFFVTVVFGDGFLGFIPTPGTFDVIAAQIDTAFKEIAELSAPVPVRRGLLLLAVLGVGMIAIVVDTFAVTLRRPSLAGLPLLALYAVPVSIDREGMRWWTFALGAAGYLWLLATDHIERVQRWGRPFRTSRREEAWASTPLGSTGRWIGAAGIAIALLAPLLVPGISAAGWFGGGGFGGGNGPGGGRSVQTINPMTQLRGQLTDDEERELLRLRTNDRDRFYLRTTTLDQFTAVGWTQRRLTALSENRVGNGIPAEDDIAPNLPKVDQSTEIDIQAFNRSAYLPIYANPTRIDVRGDWRWDDRADTVFSSRSTTNGLRYEFESSRIRYDRDLLAGAPDLDPSESVVSEYTSLGSDQPEVQQIADGLVAGKTSQYAKVMAINDYFSVDNGFRYSTETQAGTSGSLLLDFLVNKKGYCEQYASAMAYLVRAVGIPARVALGFGRGTETQNYISVTNKDAHAWVEVYFSGLGWVPFDATPAGGAGRTGGLEWAQSEDEGDNGSTAGQGNTAPGATPTPSGPARDDLREDPEANLPQASGRTGPRTVSLPTWAEIVGGPGAALVDGREVPQLPVWLRWMLGIGTVLLICAVPALWRSQTRRRRMRLARSLDQRVAAHAAWDELIDSLADLGLAADDAETPRSTARRLARTGLDSAERHAIELLATAEERARYAPRAVVAAGVPGAAGSRSRGSASVDGESGVASRGRPASRGRAASRGGAQDAAVRAEVTQRVHAVDVAWHALADRSAVRVRLRARLLPPSLLARSAQTMSRISEETSVGARNVRAALWQRLMPRRFTDHR
jgi:transglutaminase-like putative cysteine protease